MSLFRAVLLSSLICFCQLRIAFAVGAGALSTQMVGAKAQGQGNAFVAEADDPSAVYFNPAGMTQLEGTQLSLGSTFLIPEVDRTGAGQPDDKMNRQLSTIPNFYVTGSIPNRFSDSGNRLAWGLGVTAPYGLTTEWKQDSSVRYVATTSKFELLNTNPSIAAKILPTLSLGFGIDYMSLFNVESEAQTNQAFANGDNSADGTAKISGSGDGWGYNFGVLFKPLDKHSFGASYRSKVHIGIDGTVDLSGLSASSQSNFNFASSNYSTSVKSDVVLPPSVLLGYAFQPSQKWTFLADYEWTGWSVFQNQDVNVNETDPGRLAFMTGDPNSSTIRTKRNWEDVSAIGIGANFKANDRWQWRGGYAYYERVVPTANFSPDVPDAGIHLLTAGFSRIWKAWTLDFALNGWLYENRTINNNVGNAAGGSVNGKYEAFIPSMALNLSYRIM